jgi:Predicted membrane protein
MDIPYVTGIINAFAIAFNIVGAAMVIYGGARAVIELLLFGAHRTTKTKSTIKRQFTGYIIFGLEFFIAGDVLMTMLNPTAQDLMLLGAIVVIRVVLAYFLEKESKEYDIDS